jgi:hypothetical protein
VTGITLERTYPTTAERVWELWATRRRGAGRLSSAGRGEELAEPARADVAAREDGAHAAAPLLDA